MRIGNKLLVLILAAAISAGMCTMAARASEPAAGDPDPSVPLKVTAIDFGNEGWGDGTMIESGGECLLMDTFMPDCEDTLKEFLLDHGYNKFAIYLSHYHADHFGNIRRIMRDDRFTVTAVYLPDDEYLTASDNSYGPAIGWFRDVNRGIRELAEEMKIPLTVLQAGDTFTVGSAKVEILYGPSYESSDHTPAYLNNNSLVARVTGGGIRYLTCGDIEKVVEERILDSDIDLSADLYKMSHHGGATSNSTAFLQAVNPSFAFFNSIGDSPDGYARDWAKDRASAMMEIANVHSSRYNGNITYTARDGVITVRAERNITHRVMSYKADGEIGVCMVFQQFNDQQEPLDTEKMCKAAEEVIRRHGLIPAVYR